MTNGLCLVQMLNFWANDDEQDEHFETYGRRKIQLYGANTSFRLFWLIRAPVHNDSAHWKGLHFLSFILLCD